MKVEFYRFVSDRSEVDQIVHERRVQSRNPHSNYATWYTPTRYDNPDLALAELALPQCPTHRFGPISADALPGMDVYLRVVQPAYGQPGRGIEIRTSSPIWLEGLWNFRYAQWDL